MKLCLVPPKVTHIPSRSQILTLEEKVGEEEAEKGPWKCSVEEKPLVRSTGSRGRIPSLPRGDTQLWERSSDTRKGRLDLIGLSRKKQPKTCRIFPKGLQLSCVFSPQMLMRGAPETQGSFQVSASIERVKLGVLVEFHSVSVSWHQTRETFSSLWCREKGRHWGGPRGEVLALLKLEKLSVMMGNLALEPRVYKWNCL